MGRSRRHDRATRGLAVCIVLALAMLCGCQQAQLVTIQIPDFDGSSVDGVWIWRMAGEEGPFERAAEIRILSHHRSGEDGEYVVYSIPDLQGQARVAMPAAVVRDEISPRSAQISFLIHLSQPGGVYRASTYNRVGESDLSSNTLELSSS